MATKLATVFFVLAIAFGGVAFFFVRDAAGWRAKYEELNANTTKVTREAQAEADTLRTQATALLEEAKQTLASAKQEKAASLANVKTAADLIRDQELHTIYPDLKPFNTSEYTVNKRYVSGFTVADSTADADGKVSKKVSITYQNDSSAAVQPNIKIYFINARGVVTGYAIDSWTFSRIGPGERRIEDAWVTLDHGPPVYWRIEIK